MIYVVNMILKLYIYHQTRSGAAELITVFAVCKGGKEGRKYKNMKGLLKALFELFLKEALIF